MNGQKKDPRRYEVKFIGPEHLYPFILEWLRLSPFGFRVAHPPRTINNIYFDTYDYNAYDENLSGISSRSKVRYRWYGTSEFPSSGTMEVKCKRNSYGWKLNYKVPQAPYVEDAKWRDVIRLLLNQLPPEGKRWLIECPQPTLINRYDREYLISRCGKIRATVDLHLKGFDQRYKPWPNWKRHSNLPRILVLEIKCGVDDRETLTQVLSRMPLRASRCSKYVLGLKSSHGY